MKVYISVDIEGTAGTTSWQATNLGDQEHKAAARQMTLEAVAACQGAIDAGATEIYVKDAHDSGRNMDLSLFPREARVIFDWTLTPDSMVAGLDESFDALMFVGYHSPAGLPGSPLSHTMNRGNNYVKINGKLASEFLLHAYVGAARGVPSVLVTGDKLLCSHAREFVPEIQTAPVKDGLGRATINLTPQLACECIREAARKGLLQRDRCHLSVPETLTTEISFKDHFKALRASYYPGVTLTDPYTVTYTASSADEMMTTRMFIL
ncbi:MAG: M55 family metallopeptidase [Clostridium sp.]|nr:M55 family metallopeptidase [Clostridium sp.]